jgi:hypothetical protein
MLVAKRTKRSPECMHGTQGTTSRVSLGETVRYWMARRYGRGPWKSWTYARVASRVILFQATTSKHSDTCRAVGSCDQTIGSNTANAQRHENAEPLSVSPLSFVGVAYVNRYMRLSGKDHGMCISGGHRDCRGSVGHVLVPPVPEGKGRTKVSVMMHRAAKAVGQHVVIRSGGAQKGTGDIASLHAARTSSPQCHQG